LRADDDLAKISRPIGKIFPYALEQLQKAMALRRHFFFSYDGLAPKGVVQSKYFGV